MKRVSYTIECKKATAIRLLSALRDCNARERGLILSLGGKVPHCRMYGEICDYWQIPGFSKLHPHRLVCVLRIEARERQKSFFMEALREVFASDEDFRVFFLSEDEENGVYRTNDVDGTYFDDLFRIRYKVSGEAGEEKFSSELDLQDRLNELMQLPPDTDVSREAVSQWNKAHEDRGEYIRVYEYELIDDEQ